MLRRKRFVFGQLFCLAIVCSSSSVGAQPAYADGEGDSEISLDEIRAQLSANTKETKTGDSAEAATVKANGAAASPKAAKTVDDADFDAETKRLEAEEEKVLARMQPASEKSSEKLADTQQVIDSELGTIPAPKTPSTGANSDKNIGLTRESASLPEIQVIRQAPVKVIKENIDSAALQPRQDTKPAKSTTNPNNAQAVATLRAENEDLKRRIEENETKSTTLLAQLEEARNRLIIAETEVERLASVLDARNSAAVGGNSRGQGSSTRQSAAEADDMPIAIVTADKAQLRAGPSMSDSPLMAITKGTRLAVETRRGEWLRVISPAGSRAWVNLDVVSFGAKNSSSGRKSSDLGSSR